MLEQRIQPKGSACLVGRRTNLSGARGSLEQDSEGRNEGVESEAVYPAQHPWTQGGGGQGGGNSPDPATGSGSLGKHPWQVSMQGTHG